MKYAIFFTIGLFSASLAKAQQINLEPGVEFAYQTHHTESSVATKKVAAEDFYTFQFKVISRTDTAYKLECTLIKARIWQEDKLYRLNSDSIRNTELNYSGLLTQIILLNHPFTVVLSHKGKFVRTEGIAEVVKKATAPWYLEENVLQYQQGNIDGFLSRLNFMFFELPDEKLSYQSTFTNPNTKTTYKVTAMRGSLLDIVPVTVDKTSQAKYLLNDVNGLLEDVSTDYTQTGVPDPKRFTGSQTISYGKSAAPVVDSAWLTMAIPLSYWSEHFKDKAGEVDSGKVFSHFAKHDAVYKDDPYYILARLRHVQGLKGRKSFDNYRAELAKTPNEVLADQGSHLFNKLQWAAEVNADTAYNVIRYFYKYPSFGEWLQESFAQDFLRKDVPVSDELLEKLYNDKKLGVNPQISAMYSWVYAKKEPQNTKLLNQTYNKFMKMNDVYMHKGNGARYALLIYKMLMDAKMDKEANKLLDRTTQTLERFNADTLNKSRLADRNILAYTYYLKYQLALKTDSAAALAYLGKASQYSPLDKREKAYASFYDRVFLKSKESYSEEFMNKLFAGGNIDTALKIFADNISANPGRLPDMQNLYQKRFTDKSFKEFFINNVISKWKDAPAFELTGLDDKKYTLADYKGKWLVLDFWGTWCSPCREEMPKVNEFNNQLLDGKYKGINLLSVACYDNRPSVKNYISNNNFGIATTMSDNLIQQNYKVSGYPSKILIAPNGKMIDIQFGSDWMEVIKNFNELYAANL
jgi:thiol-disulfide isomerase/thioredoxin